MLMFIEQKKWQEVEPISKWKAPDSAFMSIVSAFFKLSQVLRVSWLQVVLFRNFNVKYFSASTQSSDGRIWTTDLGIVSDICYGNHISWCFDGFGKIF